MTTAWNTKYGPRRVRHDPPDLTEAITAAQGLTDDINGQAEIAAQLMDLPVATVRDEIARLAAEEKARELAAKKSRTLTINAPRRGGQTQAVVVERRSVGRPIRRVYDV
jgi:2-phospho-L-lactate guanylyltransferase (CobY/MobA/RfbA family)